MKFYFYDKGWGFLAYLFKYLLPSTNPKYCCKAQKLDFQILGQFKRFYCFPVKFCGVEIQGTKKLKAELNPLNIQIGLMS